MERSKKPLISVSSLFLAAMAKVLFVEGGLRPRVVTPAGFWISLIFSSFGKLSRSATFETTYVQSL